MATSLPNSHVSATQTKCTALHSPRKRLKHDYAKRGFLRLPWRVLKRHGLAAFALAAIRADSPKDGKSHARLEDLARLSCQPRATFHSRLQKLIEAEAVEPRRSALYADLGKLYAGNFVDVRREWLATLKPYEAILLGWIRFKCCADTKHPRERFTFTLADITEDIGGDRRTWKSALLELKRTGAIVLHSERSPFVVSIPGTKPQPKRKKRDSYDTTHRYNPNSEKKNERISAPR